MHALDPSLVLCMNLGLGLAAGAAFASSFRRRMLAIGLVFVSWWMPLLADDTNLLLTYIVALGAVVYTMRAIDLLRDRRPRSAGSRIFHMTAVFDTRLAKRIRPRLDGAGLARAAAWSALAALFLWVGVFVANERQGWVHYLLRWGGGAAFSAVSFEVIAAGIPAVWRAFGVEPPLLHDAAYRARSLGEFWGRRWNRVVGTWLRRNCFEPLARRRRPGAGLIAAFVASAIIHAYLTWVCLDHRWATLMGLFFLGQGALVATERILSVTRWRPAAGRAWAMAWMLLLSPLFTEPMIRLIDPLVASPAQAVGSSHARPSDGHRAGHARAFSGRTRPRSY